MIMKYFAGVVCLSAIVMSVSGITVTEAENFSSVSAGKVVFSTSFEPMEHKKFTLRSETQIVPKEGFNGTYALKTSRKEKNQYSVSGISIGKLPPSKYRISFLVRCEDIQDSKGNTDTRVQALSVEYSKNGQYLTGIGPFFSVPKQGEWKQVSFTFTPPAESTDTSLAFYLRKNMRGTVWIDDLRIEQLSDSSNAVVTLMKPENLTIFGSEGKIIFHGNKACGKGIPALVCLNGEKRIVFCNQNRDYETAFKRLTEGRKTLTVTLLDTKAKRKLFNRTFTVFVKYPSKAPRCAVRFDSEHRLIVDGKNFMPVAIYGLWSNAELYRNAGFNCVVDYTLFGDKGETVQRIEKIRKRLDFIQKNGLKAIISVQHQYPGRPSASVKFDNVTGVYSCVTAAAEGVREHPALLAWYVSDEVPFDGIPAVDRIRQAVSVADPWHPAVTLTCRVADMPAYANTGDVISMDPYPIRSVGKEFMITDISEQTDLSVSSGLPVWMTCQAFNWAAYDGTSKEKYASSRKITREEMVAMPLLAAIHGAKGFFFYSDDGCRVRSEKLQPGDGKIMWEKLVYTAKTMSSLAPFILGPKSIPVSFEANRAGRVHGRVFEDGTGNVRVLLVNTGSEAISRFRLPQYPVLKSRNGLIRHLGNKRYEFTVTGVKSDILEN